MVQITPEQLEALAQSKDHSVRLTDPKTNKQYLLFEEPAIPDASVEHIEYMRRGLEKAEKELAEGLGKPWDMDAFLADMHQKHRPS